MGSRRGPRGVGEQGGGRTQGQADNGANPASHRSIAGWPCCSRLQDGPLDFAARCVAHRRPDWSWLSSGSCLALAGSQRFPVAKRPERRAAVERDEKAIRRWQRTRMVCIKKKARQQRRTIVFIDESGLSTRPTRARTWAPRGQTPVLHETFNWKSLSIIGGLALWRFYFQIHAGSIKSLQVIEFLRHLQRHISRKNTGSSGMAHRFTGACWSKIMWPRPRAALWWNDC